MSGMRLTRATARGATAMMSAAVAVCAGCTSAAAHSPGTATASTTRTAAPSPTATAPSPSGALTSPGCASTVSTAGPLTSVSTAMLPVSGAPFGVAATPDGHWAFTAIAGTGAGSWSVEVLRLGDALAPTVVRDIPVPGQPLGEAITRDGKYLLVADEDGAVVISVARAEAGTAGAVLGTLHAPGGGGAIEAAVSPDGRFAFVTLEQSQSAAVFNLGAALSRGFGPADYVGTIPLGLAPVGITVSPGGRWLYATSEEGTAALSRAVPSPGTTAPATAPGSGPGEQPGTLTVINLRGAETDPAASVAATVAAGCQPVRVITSGGGTQVWVTARASDDLLCFSAARLAADPPGALVAAARVGAAPVGLAPVRGGSLLVVADSDQYAAARAHPDLDVVNVAAALAGHPAVVGHIQAAAFPRDMTLAPDGRLLVSDFGSHKLEAVDVATIPGG
jgi:DNA-binding beta-propeller fold protein YncE